MSYFEAYPGGPRDVEEVEMKLVKNVIGKTFGKTQKQLVDHLEKLSDLQTLSLKSSLSDNPSFVLSFLPHLSPLFYLHFPFPSPPSSSPLYSFFHLYLFLILLLLTFINLIIKININNDDDDGGGW